MFPEIKWKALIDGYQMADWKDALDVYMAELK
jgi:hypothetical protein